MDSNNNKEKISALMQVLELDLTTTFFYTEDGSDYSMIYDPEVVGWFIKDKTTGSLIAMSPETAYDTINRIGFNPVYIYMELMCNTQAAIHRAETIMRLSKYILGEAVLSRIRRRNLEVSSNPLQLVGG